MYACRVCKAAAVAAVCSLIIWAGCAEPEKPGAAPAPKVKPAPGPVARAAVPLVLKFTAGEKATYKLTTESKRVVTFQGSISNDPALKGGETGQEVEVVFSEEIESVDQAGNAVAKITLKQLKVKDVVRNEVKLDFDSTRDEDATKPLAKLLGQSYRIKMNPTGAVTSVMDTKQARVAVRGSAAAINWARSLLSDEAIRQRHTIAALPGSTEKKFAVGDDWTKTHTVEFGMMGNRVFERIYGLKELKAEKGHQIAIVEMNGIPSTKNRPTTADPKNPFAKMFDSVDTYTGLLELDVTAGKVRRYNEDLTSEWIMVDPNAKPGGSEQPDSLTMKAVRVHRLQRID